jgi:uncharacterized protein (TIGR00369 family)
VTIVDDGHCFGCGPHNEIGLHMRFHVASEGHVRCTTTIAGSFQGWVGMAHGGIVMTMIDEAMAHAVGAAGLRAESAEVRVRFRRPIPLGEVLVVDGRVRWQRRNVLGVDASVVDSTGRTLVSGEGRFVARGTVVPGTLGTGAA